MSGPADFKSAPGFENWPRYVGVIEQNKIFNSLCQYCTRCNTECNDVDQPLRGASFMKYWWSLTAFLSRHGWFSYLATLLSISQCMEEFIAQTLFLLHINAFFCYRWKINHLVTQLYFWIQHFFISFIFTNRYSCFEYFIH